MPVKKSSAKSGARPASKAVTKTAGKRSFSRPKATAKTAARKKGGATHKGRERRNVLLNPTFLRGAMATLGTTNISETVNVALERLAVDAAVLRGIYAATGTIPDFPYLDT